MKKNHWKSTMRKKCPWLKITTTLKGRSSTRDSLSWKRPKIKASSSQRKSTISQMQKGSSPQNSKTLSKDSIRKIITSNFSSLRHSLRLMFSWSRIKPSGISCRPYNNSSIPSKCLMKELYFKRPKTKGKSSPKVE